MRVYDAPDAILSNLFEGELTARGLTNSIFNTGGLSPAERDTLKSRLKAATAGTPMGALTSTIVGMALNPLVWLGFAFRPAAATSLGRNARIFQQEARVKPRLSLLDHGAMHANGTSTLGGVEGLKSAMIKIRSEYRRLVESPEEALIRAWGGDPRSTNLHDLSEKHPELRRKMQAMGLVAGGLHKSRVVSKEQYVPRYYTEQNGQVREIHDESILAYLEGKAQEQRQLGQTGNLKIHLDPDIGPNMMELGEQVNVLQGSRQQGKMRLIKPTMKVGALLDDEKHGLSRLIDKPMQRVMDGWHNFHKLALLRNLGRDELADSYLTHVLDPKLNPGGGRVDLVDWLKSKNLKPEDALDVEKMKAHWQVHKDKSEMFGKDEVGWGGIWEQVFHPTIRSAVNDGTFDEAHWDQLVRSGFASALSEPLPVTTWHPYEWDTKMKSQRALDPDTWMSKASASYGNATGRVPRRGLAVFSEPGLQRLAESFPGAADDLEPHLARSDNRVMERALARSPAWLSELNPTGAIYKLHNDTALEYGATAVRGVEKDKMLEIAQREAAGISNRQTGEHVQHAYQIFADEPAPDGGWTYRHAIEKGILQIPEAESRRFLTETVIPAALGKLPERHAMVEMAIGGLQTLVRNIHGSEWAKKHLGGTETGQKVLDWMDTYQKANRVRLASSLVNKTSRYIYSSTLGMPNMAPLVLQLTQRFLHEASYLGLGKSNESFFKYGVPKMAELIRERAKLPLRMSTAQRDQLFKSVLGDDASMMGFHGHEMEALDALAFHEGGEMGWKEWLVLHAPLIPFQTTEITNRLGTIGAVRARHIAAGVDPVKLADVNSYEHARLKMDVTDAQREFNMATDALSTPKLFMEKVPSQLMRQFLTFTVRAPVSAFNTSRRLAGGKREDILGISKEWPAALADTLRFAGISALVYEAGKGLGGDLSPGLAASAMSFGLDGNVRQDAQGSGLRTIPLPLPPIVSMGINIPWGIIDALGGDTALLRDNAARLLPGGVGLQKMLAGAPNLSNHALTAPLGLLQKKYVDWGNPTPDGRVGQYSWDGRLIDYQKPSALVLQGLGVDLGSHKEAGDIDGWLIKQKDEIVALRHRALMGLASNNIPQVQAAQAEFQKRFQIPLTISKQQLRAFLKQQNVPRTERILDSFPSDVRPQMLQALKSQYSRLGMESEVAMSAETSAKRGLLSPRLRPDAGMEPDTLEVLNSMVADRQRRKPVRERTFTE